MQIFERFFTTDTQLTWRQTDYQISATLKQMLLFTTFITIIWWFIGLVIPAEGRVRWGDQRDQYLTGINGLIRPYDAVGFFNPPWALLFLFPFNFVPFKIAVLLQGILYHCVLVIIAFKFSPANVTNKHKRLAALAILFSPFPADLALELNNDWIPAIGLIVPPAFSAPFILAKPQNSIGYYFALSWRQKVRSVLVGSATVVLSFFIWGFDWPARALGSVVRDDLGYSINAAPLVLFGWQLSFLLGVVLILYTLYQIHIKAKSDKEREQRTLDMTLFAVISGICFMPYIAGYSLAVVYALLAAKVPRILLGFNVLLWVVLVQVFLNGQFF